MLATASVRENGLRRGGFLAAQKDEEDGEDIVVLVEEVLEVIKGSPVRRIPERIMEQTVELAGSSGKAGSSWLGVKGTTSDAIAAVGKSFGEVWALGTAKHNVSTESELAVSSSLSVNLGLLEMESIATTGSVFAMSSGEAGSVGPGSSLTTSLAATAVAESVGEARPPGVAKHSATTAATAVAKSVEVGETRHLGVAKCSAAVIKVAEISSQGRKLQRAAEQILDDTVEVHGTGFREDL